MGFMSLNESAAPAWSRQAKTFEIRFLISPITSFRCRGVAARLTSLQVTMPFELSRGFKALKVWMSLTRTRCLEKYSKMNCSDISKREMSSLEWVTFQRSIGINARGIDEVNTVFRMIIPDIHRGRASRSWHREIFATATRGRESLQPARKFSIGKLHFGYANVNQRTRLSMESTGKEVWEWQYPT